jgi:hypothetical protein
MRVVITIEKSALEAALVCLEGEGFVQDETFGQGGIARDLDDPTIVRVRGAFPRARLADIDAVVGVVRWEEDVTLEAAQTRGEALVDALKLALDGPPGVTVMLAVNADGSSRAASVPDEIIGSREALEAFADKLHKPKSDE